MMKVLTTPPVRSIACVPALARGSVLLDNGGAGAVKARAAGPLSSGGLGGMLGHSLGRALDA